MARRSSARIRNRNSSTPKRVSLSHDALPHTPRTAPVKLQTLREHDVMPGAFPGSASPPSPRESNTVAKVPVKFNDTTPEKSTPIKPAADEMHPAHHQQSTAKPWDEARWLGISNMVPQTEPPKQTSKIAMLQATPTKASRSSNEVECPRFKFTFAREQSLELSPEAKKLMSEKREEALKIRAQMVANGEGSATQTELNARRIATPKGKKNRFSEVHLEQFRKMDSIAGHASAFRAQSVRTRTTTTADKSTSSTEMVSTKPTAGPSTLKRSPSKAGLEELGRIEAGRSANKSTAFTSTHKHAASGNVHEQSPAEGSPRKRVKHYDADDERTEKSKKDVASISIATPPWKQALMLSTPSGLKSTVASPTQAFLARAASVKSTKSTKIPAPMHPATDIKAASKNQNKDELKSPTPLLARPPLKSALLMSSSAVVTKAREAGGSLSPLLLRTPSKSSPIKNPTLSTDEKTPTAKKVPLLSRSPLKSSKSADVEANHAEGEKTPPVALLSRSPAKIKMPEDDFDGMKDSTASHSTASGLAGRFKLLRASPIKSILRSPQRLYSTDPAKIAAGTHLASPATAVTKKETASVQSPTGKHVDFSSSTKARYERAQSEVNSPASRTESKTPAKVSFANYPTLPTAVEPVSTPAPERRRTVAPGDFTFGSHGGGIVFGQSPNAPASAANKSRPSTIRHVSAEPERVQPIATMAFGAAGKKRKFEAEDDHTIAETKAKAVPTEAEQNKENVEEQEPERPAKRMKASTTPPAVEKPKTRLPTLGVKPKKGANDGKDKKPSVISRARLNALAQPKRKV